MLLGPRSAAATVVLEQPPTVGDLGGGGGLSNISVQQFDDFRLAGDTTITGVGWHGSIGLLAGPGNFVIQFFLGGDSFYPVASPFFSETVTALGTQTKDYEFEYFATLANPVTLPGETNLWISIAVDDDSSFTWANAESSPSPGQLPSGLSVFRISDGPLQLVKRDAAFSLVSDPTSVPEPGTLALVVGGLAGVGLLRRRNRS